MAHSKLPASFPCNHDRQRLYLASKQGPEVEFSRAVTIGRENYGLTHKRHYSGRYQLSHVRGQPNKEEIDWIAERVREIYDYERLKDCDIDYLYNQEFGMRADAHLFEMIFPHEESTIQGPIRAFLLDQDNADREALTEAEQLRLHTLKKEAEIEIRRAFGHRKELRREHRNKLANSIADALGSLGSLFRLGK